MTSAEKKLGNFLEAEKIIKLFRLERTTGGFWPNLLLKVWPAMG